MGKSNLVFPAEFLIKIADITGIRFHYTVAHSVRRTVDLIFIGKRKDMIPFLSIMVNIGTAFPRKSQDALPVVADPDVRDLFLQIRYLLMQFTLRFLPDPSEDAIPGIQLQRADLDQGEKQDERR